MLDYDTTMRIGQRRYQDVLDMLAASRLGATFTQTGGMNVPLEVLLDGGHTLLITDAEDSLSWDRAEHAGWAVGLYPPDHVNEGGDCLAFGSTDDGSPAVLLALAQSVLDQYVRSTRPGGSKGAWPCPCRRGSAEMSARAHSVRRMVAATSTRPLPDASTSCDATAVGARLRALRRAAGLTQLELARRLGTTQSAVARLEAGRQRLSLAALQRAATELGCDVTVVISEQRVL